MSEVRNEGVSQEGVKFILSRAAKSAAKDLPEGSRVLILAGVMQEGKKTVAVTHGGGVDLLEAIHMQMIALSGVLTAYMDERSDEFTGGYDGVIKGPRSANLVSLLRSFTEMVGGEDDE